MLPVLTFEEFVFWKHTFSVLTGIQSLLEGGNVVLAAILFFFSVVFPFTKLVTLGILWYGSFPDKVRTRILFWLEALGRWSMLDVFVIAVTIVIAKSSKFVKAEAHVGIYVFALSVMLAMLVTSRVERLARRVGAVKT